MCSKNMALVAFIIIACLAGTDAARGDTSRKLLRGPTNAPVAGPVKKLLGSSSNGGSHGDTSYYRSTNTLRSETATADAILRAVNGGARLRDNFIAAGVGSQTVFANAQNDKALFDQVDFVNRNGKKLQQVDRTPFLISDTLRSESATADAIDRTVNGGATLPDAFRTAGVGEQTVFANTQNDPGLFDQVEFVDRAGRKLLQSEPSRGPAGTNTLRSQMATADSIARAVNGGARQYDTARAAGVGMNTVFANTQGGAALFDQVEFVSRNGKK